MNGKAMVSRNCSCTRLVFSSSPLPINCRTCSKGTVRTLDPELRIGPETFGKLDGTQYHVRHMVPNAAALIDPEQLNEFVGLLNIAID